MDMHSLRSTHAESEPRFFNLVRANDRRSFEKIVKSEGVQVVNEYTAQLKELFLIDHPELLGSHDALALFEEQREKLTAKTPEWQQGMWVYFPWIHTLVHILSNEEFQRVRLSRNRNLITESEQQRLYNSTVGIVGLSIGMSAALTIALQGVSRKMKLADFDSLELSNLNRIPSGVHMLGISKVNIAARHIYLLNPYADLELYPKGLEKSSMSAFFKGVDVVVDEADSFTMKQQMREYAKKRRIPLVSGADVGERAVISIERYDTDPATKPFHGRITISQKDSANMDKKTIGGLIAQSVGLENHGTRMLTWPKQLGRAGGIVSFPQLGGTALLNATAVAYAVRCILLGIPVLNDQRCIALDEIFLESTYLGAERKDQKNALGEFMHLFGIEGLQ
jgi:molybdopterin/thiamine biosynthesis adenylyltransferase